MTLPDCNDDSGPASPGGSDDSPMAGSASGNGRGMFSPSTVFSLDESAQSGRSLFAIGSDIQPAGRPTGADWLLALAVLGGFAYFVRRR